MSDNTSIPIYTIGHGDRTLDELIMLLRQYEIAFLIDVRRDASAASAAFPQSALATALAAADIRYVEMGVALGSEPTADAHTYEHAIGRLQNAFRQQHRVALLGQPAAPAACHRSYQIGAHLAQLQIPVVHIDERGALQPQVIDTVRSHNAARVVTPDRDAAARVGETPLAVLKQVFGYEEFRPLQAQIVENLLTRQDTLVIMPTGGGKSLCYQLPALLLPGLTLVVSPLIALMQDQVDQLRQLGVAAAFLNSTLTAVDYRDTVQQVRSGQIKLLYMAPETLLRSESLHLLAACRLELIAIDEAHCISQWGHDFRPEYRQLVTVRQRFPQAVCLALTATATPRVQQDITESLALRSENAFVASFDRPNLMIRVQPKVEPVGQILDFLAAHPDQSGIIYCSTQRHVDDLSSLLREQGIAALPYHAGLDKSVREQNQRAFMVDDVRVMVATIAFGMGVDKPDVRFVLHVDLPQDVENYYQQIGRAGRDGERADCLLLFGYGDVHTIQHFIRTGAEAERAGRLQRLQTLVNWAEAQGCRRQPLLAYFGETYGADNCGMCDNCTVTAEEQVDLTVAAQKFLSCVVRTGQKFGAGHVINVLRGSRAQAVLKWGHERLSTHGIGQDYTEQTWKQLAQQFLQQGLLTHEVDYGTLSVSEQGGECCGARPRCGGYCRQRPAARRHRTYRLMSLRSLNSCAPNAKRWPMPPVCRPT
ncbi:MAG: DNA helicase RecQ [Caldilineaceae bacterium]